MTEDSRTTGSLLARRALAEKATPGPWVRKGEYLVYGPWEKESSIRLMPPTSPPTIRPRS